MTTDVTEKQQSLWRLVAAPALWAAHFMLCYITASVWCAKFTPGSGSFVTVRTAIFAYTVAALLLIARVAWSGWQRHTLGNTPPPHDADSAPSRHRFLGFATLLLSGLSAIAVVFQTLPALFIGSCQ